MESAVCRRGLDLVWGRALLARESGTKRMIENLVGWVKGSFFQTATVFSRTRSARKLASGTSSQYHRPRARSRVFRGPTGGGAPRCGR